MLKHLMRTPGRLTATFMTLLVSLAGLSVPLPSSAEPLTQRPGLKVFLLRGFTNVLSPGIDQLEEELRRRDINTTIANHLFYSSLAEEALQDCMSGRASSIVLVGHSFGASAALSMAETLNRQGVQVALVVTFDPVLKNSVPANVQRLENFYLSDGVGQPVQQGDHFRGALENVDLRGNAQVGHISVTTYPSIHERVLKDILAAKTRCRS